MNYKVTLWSNSDFCKYSKDPTECTYSVLVTAENRYQAAEKVLAQYKAGKIDPAIMPNIPIVYEITMV